jgi:hypothetical protein
MEKTSNTRLRYVKSKSADTIIEYTNKLLPYKIEIKGAPTYVEKRWYLWFILPENLMKELPFGDLD